MYGLLSSKSNNTPKTYKVVTLGSSGVGKTSLMLRFVQDSFSEDQCSTIGASFLVKRMNIAWPPEGNNQGEIIEGVREASSAPIERKSVV